MLLYSTYNAYNSNDGYHAVLPKLLISGNGSGNQVLLTEIKSQDWRRAVLGWEAYEADRKLLNSYDTGSTVVLVQPVPVLLQPFLDSYASCLNVIKVVGIRQGWR